MVELTCAVSGCGVTFLVTKGFNERRRADKENISCPCGHLLSYPGESDAMALARSERELNRAKSQTASLVRELKKTPCPYCGKRFSGGINRHIRAKHPGKTLVQRKK